MVDDQLAYLSESEASRLWKRAAELQLMASRRAERRTKELQASPGSSGLRAGENLSVHDTLAAGREVGIDDDFLEAALAEVLEERAAGRRPPPDPLERLARWFLGRPPAVVEASGIVPAPPQAVYRALQRILPVEPLALRLRQTLGRDPLRDGVLVFDAPAGAVDRRSYARKVLMAGGRIERISVTIRPLATGDEPQTRITIRGRVDADHEPAFWKGGSLTVLSSVVGAALGAVAAPGLGLFGLTAVVSVTGFAGAGGGWAYWAHRWSYQGGFDRSAHAMQELVEVVEAAVRTHGAFLTRPERGRDPEFSFELGAGDG